MRRKAPAVISVVAALTWCLAASMVFVLLDGVRVAAMGQFLEDRIHLTCRNTMANYQKELYEEYGLLGVDEAFSQSGEGSWDVVESMLRGEWEYEKELERKNQSTHSVFSTRVNLLNYPSVEVGDSVYQVLSDGGGEVFLRQASAYMTALLPDLETEELLGEYSELETVQQGKDMEQIYREASGALQTAGELLEQYRDKGADLSVVGLEKNSMTSVEKQRKDPVLDLVLPNREISSAYMDVIQAPSHRSLQKGTMPAGSVTTQEKLLGICYCSRMFPDFLSDALGQEMGSSIRKQQESGLRYQMEYLIAGKSSDRENLSSVCSKLLLIREAVQLSRYCADPQQNARAYTEAMALVGFTGNPALIKAVRLGLLAAWSFEEAVQDVQDLLEGKTVGLMGTVTSAQYGYRDYLKFLLFLKPAGLMAMRSMDIIEKHVNAKLESGSFHVDRTITAMQGSAEAKIPWLFVNLITVPVESWKTCRKSVSWSEDYY